MTNEIASLDEQIIEITNVIAFYAKRLTLMRGRDVAKEARSRSYLSRGSAETRLSNRFALVSNTRANLC